MHQPAHLATGVLGSVRLDPVLLQENCQVRDLLDHPIVADAEMDTMFKTLLL